MSAATDFGDQLEPRAPREGPTRSPEIVRDALALAKDLESLRGILLRGEESQREGRARRSLVSRLQACQQGLGGRRFLVFWGPFLAAISLVLAFFHTLENTVGLVPELRWCLFWLVVAGMLIGTVRYCRLAYPGSREEFAAVASHIERVSGWLSRLNLETFHAAIVGMTTSNFLAGVGVSKRGDTEPSVAGELHKVLVKGVTEAVVEAQETSPVLSFESLDPSTLWPVKQVYTAAIQSAVIGSTVPGAAGFVPAREDEQIHIRKWWSTSPIEIDARKEIETLISAARDNFHREAESEGKHYLDEDWLNRSRVELVHDQAGRELRFIRICFWPKEILRVKAARVYIELQELAGVPTLWVERNEDTVGEFLEAWRNTVCTLSPSARKTFCQYYASPNQAHVSPETWTPDFDFFVGRTSGWIGYPGRRIPPARVEPCLQFFHDFFFGLSRCFEGRVQFAKDAAWLEFLRTELGDNRDDADTANRLIANSGFGLWFSYKEGSYNVPELSTTQSGQRAGSDEAESGTA